MPVPEAALSDTRAGKVPASDGWFILNVAEAQGMETESYGAGTRFEAPDRKFPEFGINVRLLQPGQPCALYHRESQQEAFFVISGECTAIVEDEQRPLRKGDLFYAPPGTAHIVVGAGEGPSTVLMVGARKMPEELLYPVSAVAAKYGASVDVTTADEDEAYGDTWQMRLKTLPFNW